MKKKKFKVGDIVNVRHVGECKVMLAKGSTYLLKRGIVVFSVDESEIIGKMEDKHERS